jgi:hypothetical protein
MDLSVIRTYAYELKNIIHEEIDKLTLSKREKDILYHLLIYVTSNEIDLKEYLFDERYGHLGTPVEKIKEIVNTAIDLLTFILDNEDFSISIEGADMPLKERIFDFLKEKIELNQLNYSNYKDFVEYLKFFYHKQTIIDIIRIRIIKDDEKKEEIKAILEYLTLLNRNFIQDEEIDHIQEAINFRLNKLKNYNIDYFIKNFLLLRNLTRLNEGFPSLKHFYPEDFIKDLKNLILEIERDFELEKVPERNPLEVIRLNQEKIESLIKKNKGN